VADRRKELGAPMRPPLGRPKIGPGRRANARPRQRTARAVPGASIVSSDGLRSPHPGPTERHPRSTSSGSVTWPGPNVQHQLQLRIRAAPQRGAGCVLRVSPVAARVVQLAGAEAPTPARTDPLRRKNHGVTRCRSYDRSPRRRRACGRAPQDQRTSGRNPGATDPADSLAPASPAPSCRGRDRDLGTPTTPGEAQSPSSAPGCDSPADVARGSW
jgi:hypothetical protein